MRKLLFILILLSLPLVAIYQSNKALPEHVSYAGSVHTVESTDVHFFSDTTYVDFAGARESDQQIFDEMFRMIENAQEYILIDLFLFNDFNGVATTSYRQISGELVDALMDKKKVNPDIRIQVITDPINTIYGGVPSEAFDAMRYAGIPVIVTDLKPLRDSNPVYSPLWRTFFQWFGNSKKEGYLPNPFDSSGQKLSLRTYLALLNYKANHRKVVLSDYDKDGRIGFSTLITSANPHDGSSAHSNTAVRIDAHIWNDVLTTEEAVADFSNHRFAMPETEFLETIEDSTEGTVQVQLLTEGAIKDRVIDEIDLVQAGDSLDMAMFYLADRSVVRALSRADKRGVHIRLLLDPNKDAFGREKKGTPNRQVAHELLSNSTGATQIRWCHTHGEQCHSKSILTQREGIATFIQGSANLTKRNIGNYNLETNVFISGPSDSQVFVDAAETFQMRWSNETESGETGKLYSVPYVVYEDDSLFRTIMYRVKEFTGLSRW
jgi:phosphatidylserine/phosphatidylglycerophosphate/cardiolipin synthase-like enzyme